ncbi:ATP-grasp fold amidoligase family protein [Aestuariibius sp. HNIBRBA575]|uniref:ATP-grasp fold amidoligase family protein n=1 Tax=Aestuariibius sp. HNIBRBA575 TaxID=3233343 RepID=UPI0034A29622
MTLLSEFSEKMAKWTACRGAASYYRKNDVWPNFIEPTSFGAMNILHSVTMAMPRVNPADKLLVGECIPSDLEDTVSTATVAGAWSNADDMDFRDIKPGTYYLKANHGSAMNVKVELPCSDIQMKELRKIADEWLHTAYGKSSSQWWYFKIDRKVFLEQDLLDGNGDGSLTDFRFHVINGAPVLLQMDVGLHSEDRHNPVYDENLNYLPHDFLRVNKHEEPLPENADKAQQVAVRLAKGFQYCRVDLYLRGKDLFLGEMTFLPNAGRRHVRSAELDEMLCAAWDPMPRFHRVT